jgi:hypothetical protein
LFGYRNFKRITATPGQDSLLNDGSKTENAVKLDGKDALFLIKID